MIYLQPRSKAESKETILPWWDLTLELLIHELEHWPFSFAVSYNFLTTSYFISCEHAAQLYMLRKGWGHMLFDPSYKISAVFEDP